MKHAVMMMVVALSCAAFAQGPAQPAAKGRPAGPVPGSVEPIVRLVQNKGMATRLGVSEEQVEKLKALPDFRAEIKALQAKVKVGQERQAELLKADKIDEAAVMAALDEAWNAKKEVARLQTRRVIAVKSILTPEQVRKALDAVKSLRKNPAPKVPRAKDGEKKPAKAKAGPQ